MSNARRMAVTLGLDPDLDTARLIQELRGKPMQWEAAAPRFEPEVVKTGPIFENVVERCNVDLTRFPAPRWHDTTAAGTSEPVWPSLRAIRIPDESMSARIG